VRWLEQKPAEQQAGRAAGRERDAPHVVDGEGDPGRGRGPRPGDERDRLVEAEGASRTQDRGEQAGGVAGAAAEVDGQAERPAGDRSRKVRVVGSNRSASGPSRRAAGAESPKA
jgi:hypothetical protein